jgi:hypothetical protein
MNSTAMHDIHAALDTLRDISEVVWSQLPLVTTGLQFGAAAISFALSLSKIVRTKKQRQDPTE